MRKYKGEDLLKHCTTRIDEQIYLVNAIFSSQKEDALITAPLPEKWSAKQSLEHLNLVLSFYLPKVEQAVLSASETDKTDFKHSFVGRFVLKGVSNHDSKKKTASILSSKVSGKSSIDVVIEFALLMKKFQELIKHSGNIDLDGVKVCYANRSYMNLRLGDLFHYLILHNDRHFTQMKKAIELCRKHR